MKVLIINTVEFSRLNGMTSVIMNYYRNMDKSNIQMDLLVINEIEQAYSDEFKKNGSKVYYLQRKKNPLYYCLKLKSLLEKEGYDIVHVHGNSAMMLPEVWIAKRAKIPVRIAHVHNTTCAHMLLHRCFYPVFRRTYTHGFACGEDAGRWLFREQPFVEIKNGIEVKQYAYKEEVRTEYRNHIHAEGRKVIGHIGNFIVQKNHSFLIDVFAQLIKKDADYLLLLISEGYLLEEIKEKVEKLGLTDQVIFVGKTTEVSKYLQAMDLFVLPSLHEGLPVSLIEAQAAGLPCIVADTVAREADLTDSIEYLSIQDSDIWVNQIQEKIKMLPKRNREECSAKWQAMIGEVGYDITCNANKMRELYFSYYNEH